MINRPENLPNRSASNRLSEMAAHAGTDGRDSDIDSFFFTARALVSRVEDMEEEKRKLILVVGHPTCCASINQFLRGALVDCEILTAITLEKACDFATLVVPDLIILTNTGGMELIQRLKATSITRDIPVIVTTADFCILHSNRE